MLGDGGVDDGADVRSIRDIAEIRRCADRTGCLEDRVVPIGDDDRAPLGDEPFREGAAQSTRCPGDDDDMAGQVSHGVSRPVR